MASLALLLYPPSRPARLGAPASPAAALGAAGAAACAAGRLVCTVMRGFTENLALGAAGFAPPPALPSAADASGFRSGGAGAAPSSRRCTCQAAALRWRRGPTSPQQSACRLKPDQELTA